MTRVRSLTIISVENERSIKEMTKKIIFLMTLYAIMAMLETILEQLTCRERIRLVDLEIYTNHK